MLFRYSPNVLPSNCYLIRGILIGIVIKYISRGKNDGHRTGKDTLFYTKYKKEIEEVQRDIQLILNDKTISSSFNSSYFDMHLKHMHFQYDFVL